MCRIFRVMNISHWIVYRRHSLNVVSVFTTYCNLMSQFADVMCIYLFWVAVKTTSSNISKQRLQAGPCNEGALSYCWRCYLSVSCSLQTVYCFVCEMYPNGDSAMVLLPAIAVLYRLVMLLKHVAGSARTGGRNIWLYRKCECLLVFCVLWLAFWLHTRTCGRRGGGMWLSSCECKPFDLLATNHV